MTFALCLLGLVLLYCIWAKIADWREEQHFRQKLQRLQSGFDELPPDALDAGQQALDRLTQLTASIEAHPAYQRQQAYRQAVRRGVAKAIKRNSTKRR